ncbi:MAG: succinate--CoA ligase [Alphaproteobacteria bacterium]|nr:succinate--CoA ligase [Alphaproteobacteria bacterium]
MNFEEHAAKRLIAGAIATPRGRLCATPDDAAAAVTAIGPAAVKAQVPAGKRGKSGGIKLVATPDEAAEAARKILGIEIAGHKVARVLVEGKVDIARELYAAVLNDAASKGPLVLFSTEGGMDIEEVAATRPAALVRHRVDIRAGLGPAEARAILGHFDLGASRDAIADALVALYRLYRELDAELIEINPLALTGDGKVVALDCKLTADDGALGRHPGLEAQGTPDRLTQLEQRGRELGLKFIELDGDVGVLANGAGLTMTTMDAVAHFGGRPANFLEIGGEAYRRAEPALRLVLDNPRVKSLVVNFCGAFARTDVMAEGVISAWLALRPTIPVFFSVHGTGEDEAVAMIRARLGIEPYDLMEDAVKAAVDAAKRLR